MDLHFYTVAELAELLKMHPQVIARKLASGDMEGYKIGKDWRVSEPQLMTFLERHSNKRRVDPVIDNFFADGKLKSIPTTRKKRLVVLKHLVARLEPTRI